MSVNPSALGSVQVPNHNASLAECSRSDWSDKEGVDSASMYSESMPRRDIKHRLALRRSVASCAKAASAVSSQPLGTCSGGEGEWSPAATLLFVASLEGTTVARTIDLRSSMYLYGEVNF